MKLLAAAAFAALLLAGCNSSGAPPVAAAPPPAAASISVTPSNFVMPAGSGCAGEIARYRAIQDNDLAMGHVAKSVYNQIKGEIAGAEQACAAGKDAEARAMIIASRKRHGYPTDL
jgi:PBP1b-binding outer membrane lipoprotein LpoB